jgi:ketosteroid isomerase-like protein
MNGLNKLMLVSAALTFAMPSTFASEEKHEQTTFKFEEGTQTQCKVSCGDQLNEECEESKKVIETLRKIFEAYGRHDMKTAGEYVADDCTGFDDAKKLLVGKKAVLENLEKSLESAEKDKQSPLLSYTIEKPYAQVTGDTAIVSFVAYKSYGGKRPHSMVSRSTDIFVKRDGKWLGSHYRRSWKELPANKTVATTETK